MKAWPQILLFVSVSIYSATIIPSEENLRAAVATHSIVFFASSDTIKLNAPIEINGGGTLGPNTGVDHALAGAIYFGYVELTASQCTFRANHTKAGANGAAHGGTTGFHYANNA